MFYIINRLRFLFLFIVLISYCFFKAFGSQFGFTITDILFGVLIASGLLIIGHREKQLIILISSIVAILIGLKLCPYFLSSEAIMALRLIFSLIFLVWMTYYCLYFTNLDKSISVTTLFGSVSGYLFIGLIFANAYLLVELLIPNSFNGLKQQNEVEAIYFSFITLTTVGYGEIVPLKPLSQTITWLEAVIGQLYLAMIIGLLVGRFEAHRVKRKQLEEEQKKVNRA